MKTHSTELVVLGAGPGGYAAAFYAAERGKKVTMVEQERRLGGTCLTVGCIPSKTLLHAAKLLTEVEESDFRGIAFGKPEIDLRKMRAWKESIVDKLAAGVAGIAERRKVEVVHGRGYFEGPTTLRVETEEGQRFISYEKAIIAVGSKPAMPDAFDLGSAGEGSGELERVYREHGFRKEQYRYALKRDGRRSAANDRRSRLVQAGPFSQQVPAGDH